MMVKQILCFDEGVVGGGKIAGKEDRQQMCHSRCCHSIATGPG
jgi:hypothetical protein